MQKHVTSFSEIKMENDWRLLILRHHSQCTTSLMENCSMIKKILKILSEIVLLHFSQKLVSVNLGKRNNFKPRKPPQRQVKYLPKTFLVGGFAPWFPGWIFSSSIILKSLLSKFVVKTLPHQWQTIQSKYRLKYC